MKLPGNVREARRIVIALDLDTCVASRLDPLAGPCYDKWGRIITGYDPSGNSLEVDRVTDEPMLGSNSEDDIPAHLDIDRLVTLCPGHHRGAGPNKGRQWATANRERLRDYLARRAAWRRSRESGFTGTSDTGRSGLG